MRSLSKVLLLSTIVFSTANAQAEEFGSFAKKPGSEVSVKKLLDDSSPDGLVQTKGKVAKVCEMKGCWMMLEDQGASMRIVFKDYSFFVSKKLVGKSVLVEGLVKRKEQSVAEQKHYLEDEGAPAAKIEAVTKPLQIVYFEASGVKTL